jgi:hypothetical protein
MKLSKYDVCDSCRGIRLSDGSTIGELFDSKGYNSPNPIGAMMLNLSILAGLEDKGGCPSCINVLRRANQS